jgi:serine/threonine protein kinase
VIASGGFGCVFSPALQCQGKKEREKNTISKLMTEKNALDEYNEINKLKQKIKHISNYENYFLVYNFSLCKPVKLNKTDLKNFDKCNVLKKKGIQPKNINQSLDKLLALNMPNGGIPVDDFIFKNTSYYYLNHLNLCLVDLLNNGIVHMNQKHVYHCDIKDSNILVDHQDDIMRTRLIDWGLSTEYTPKKNNKFPTTWRNRPLQYNVPFSVILFTDLFFDKYTDYIKNGGQINADELRPFVIDYIHLWMNERGDGHYKYINHIMFVLFSNELTHIKDEKLKTQIIETDFTMMYMINYIIEVLLYFTKFRANGTLNMRIYLDNVFVKIVDIWGFVITYFPMIESLFENYSKLKPNELELFDHLKNIFIDYLFKPRVQPINIQNLTNELKLLNTYLQPIQIKVKKQTHIQTKTHSSIPKTSKIKRMQMKKNRTRRNNNLMFLSSKYK